MVANGQKASQYGRASRLLVDGQLYPCVDCGEMKAAAEFWPSRSKYKSEGKRIASECKPCHSKRSEQIRRAKHESDHFYRARAMMRQLVSRGHSRGLPVLIEMDWIFARLKDGRCEVTGLPFDLVGDRLMGQPRALCPTIDRIDPKRGYVPGNVQMVTWLYNRAKGRDSHEVVMMLVNALSTKE